MKAKPMTIDEYLAGLSDEPAFHLNDVIVAGFGAGKYHLAYYPFSSSTVKQFEKELEGFETSKGAIRFQPVKPLPAALVRKLIKARIAEG